MDEKRSVDKWLVDTDDDEQLSQRLLRRLAQHGLGEVEMDQTEIAAAKEFLSRTAPPKRPTDDDDTRRHVVPVVNVWIGGKKKS